MSGTREEGRERVTGGAKRARTGQTNTFYSLSVYWHGPVTHGTSLTRRH